ncbi:zinc-binding dehydrogenase [Microbacterium sp. X-17]|uniref:zinc-binding dehydrogenase n=1 Tax=Microbacterium sp. X-17 TaxID=3144404 RepID=UPI0031F53453
MATEASVVVLPAGGGPLVVRDIVLPAPDAHQVVVEVSATGVCHSQLGHIAAADPAKPLLLGHEAYGRVTAVGADVTHVQPGDGVFVTWIPRSAERRPTPTTVGLPDGESVTLRNVFTWGTHCVVDEQFVVKAQHDIPPAVASIIGCAVMTGGGAVVNSAEVRPGQSVAVWGVGGVGLVSVAAARRAGASVVIAIDVADEKLALAARMGATHLINVREEDPVARVREIAGVDETERGVDVSIDCTGRADNIAKSLAAARSGRPGSHQGGSVVIVSVIRGPIEIPGHELLNGQKRIIGCLGGSAVPDRDFAQFVDWYLAGELDLDALITDRYSLSDVNRAVEDLRAGKVLGRAVLEL